MVSRLTKLTNIFKVTGFDKKKKKKIPKLRHRIFCNLYYVNAYPSYAENSITDNDVNNRTPNLGLYISHLGLIIYDNKF